MSDASPPVRFTMTTDGVRIAYASAGTGPPLVFVRALNTHAEQFWSDPWMGPFFRALARAFTVVVYDSRGNGLADRGGSIDLDVLLVDLGTVIKHAGLEDPILFGQGFGSPVAIAYAARESASVRALVLFCAYARGSGINVSPEFVATMRTLPDAAAALMGRSSNPDSQAVPARHLDLRSLNADPETAAEYFEFARTVDVHEFLPSIQCPVLVLQPERSPVVPYRLGREVAAAIPEANFQAIPGGGYNPWAELAVEPTLRALGSLVGSEIAFERPRPLNVGGTVAILFTDIEGSTALTSELGDEAAQELVRLHNAIVRESVASHRGHEVRHTGDGLMALFGVTSDAVRCALSIQRSLAERKTSFRVRVGIHAGEPHWEGEEVHGTVVQTAARILDRADPGSIFVSDVVRSVVAGKGFRFTDRGEARLKGLPEPVRVHEVDFSDPQPGS